MRLHHSAHSKNFKMSISLWSLWTQIFAKSYKWISIMSECPTYSIRCCAASSIYTLLESYIGWVDLFQRQWTMLAISLVLWSKNIKHWWRNKINCRWKWKVTKYVCLTLYFSIYLPRAAVKKGGEFFLSQQHSHHIRT